MTACDALLGLILAITAGFATALAILLGPSVRSAFAGLRLPRTETGDVDQTALSIGVIPVVAVATLALVGRLS